MTQESARERTRLSWRRTTLAATVVLALITRLALLHPSRSLALAVTALSGLCWVALLATAHRRIRKISAAARPSRRVLFACTAACACFGALGVVLVLA